MDASLVSRSPDIMSGAVCFTGTRVPVQNLFDYIEGSSSLEEFLEDFPSVSREKAIAAEGAHPLHATHARHSHPASNATPPNGVIAPSQRVPVTLRT
jgi:uncharacterized protein (DUF433 family)